MRPLHARIVDELVEEYRSDPHTVAIMLFGSLARGEETRTSDVDIEIISRSAQEWDFRQTEQRYGIPIDLVICPKDDLLDHVERYPYLCYEYLRERIIYDPEGFMARIREQLKK
jgi:predicted nucleotidyltransferase